MKNKTIIRIIQYAIILVLLSPPLVYIAQFGIHLSNIHNKWAEFGSFLSGIYTPIISILTICLVAKQIQLQFEQNKFHKDQNFLQNAKEDIEYFLGQIDILLRNKVYFHNHLLKTKIETLNPYFNVKNPQNYNSIRYILDLIYTGTNDTSSYKELSIELFKDCLIDNDFIQISGLWGQIYSILIALKSQEKESFYQAGYTTSLGKITSFLTYATCVHLDNYHYLWQKTINEENSTNNKIEYEFFNNK